MSIFTPRRRKRAFIKSLPAAAVLLDVGCGSGSPQLAKSVRPDIYYVGIDVADYGQTEATKSYADEYIIASPENFDEDIKGLGQGRFDAVVSNHNLEHCLHPDRVLAAICEALKPGGRFYLAFPSEASLKMPSRRGTLNFHDDPTHRQVPKWRDTLQALQSAGMKISYCSQRYRPWAGVLIGLVFEPFVAPFGRQAPKAATWALYGFESVIWAEKESRGLRSP